MTSKHRVGIMVALSVVAIGVGGERVARQMECHRLGHALIQALQKQDSAAALALVNAGADPDARVGDNGPLSIQDLVRTLVNGLRRHSPPVKKTDGLTALALAIDSHKDSTRLVQALLVRGADPNLRYHDGSTPLMEAACAGQTVAIQALLQHGADVNASTTEGRTALMYAATFNQAHAAELLLDHGADADLQSTEGETALMQAISYGDNQKTFQLLLARKVAVNLEDRSGETALDVANRYGRTEMIAALKKQGAKQNKPTPQADPHSMFGEAWGVAQNMR